MSRFPHSSTFATSKGERNPRLPDLEDMIKNMLKSKNSHQSPMLKMNGSRSLDGRNPFGEAVSLQPVLSRKTENGDVRMHGCTDSSSSPGGSTSISFPPPLQLPKQYPVHEEVQNDDGFLELATRSTATDEKVSGQLNFTNLLCLQISQSNWIDECFGNAKDPLKNELQGMFETASGVELNSVGLLSPTPSSRPAPAPMRVNNPWADALIKTDPSNEEANY